MVVVAYSFSNFKIYIYIYFITLLIIYYSLFFLNIIIINIIIIYIFFSYRFFYLNIINFFYLFSSHYSFIQRTKKYKYILKK